MALANLGSITAMRGGESGSPVTAIRLVTDGLALIDRAISLAPDGSETLATALMHRGSVSMSIPEAVFGEARAGADAFLAASRILEGIPGGASTRAEALANAAVCLEIAGADERARVVFREAATIADASAAAQLVLAERGWWRPE